ncbi:MAG: sigma-70 family RNA polymerase sigma factor [Terracidiphilus sp.]
MHSSTLASFDGINGNDDAASRDMELVVAARAGSSAAFEELQSLYSRRLYNRIFSMTRNREDAEDALQDTFLRAYVALNTFEGRSQFASWLTRIAINSALMTLRKRRSRAEVSFDLPSESEEPSQTFDVCDSALNPEQIYEQRQRCYCALRAVHKLHPRLRAALSTWMKQECSMKEVARTLDLTVAAVKARLHRARKRLNWVKDGETTPGSLSGAKRRRPMRRLQNREQPCLTCD